MHLDLNLPIELPCADVDALGAGSVGNGIRQQVQEHLLEPIGVTLHQKAIAISLKLNHLAGGQRLNDLHRQAKHAGQVKLLPFQV